MRFSLSEKWGTYSCTILTNQVSKFMKYKYMHKTKRRKQIN